MYINCHSYFSMRYGVLSVKALVDLALTHQIPSLALTDIHNVSACFEFVKSCKENGIHPVVGMEFRVNDKLFYIALAKNLKGFQEINAFYSQYAHIGEPFPEIAPLWNNVYVIYPWKRRGHTTLSEHEFLGIHPAELNQLVRSRYHHRQDKLVILQPVTFLDKRGFNQHRLMRAIDHNLVLSKLSHSQQANEGETFLPPTRLREAFEGFPQIMKNTEELLASCQFEFSFGVSHTRQTYTGDKYGDIVLLEQLAMEGMEKRYGLYNTEAAKRLERELQIIDKLNFNAYFLITWDFVKYSQHRGFFHVGRGSGANSLVAYCLGITDVDPLELNLYFERFLNPKRTSPPDFDIDYSWKERDEVIRYVLKRYRESHTAMIATYSTFKARAAIRELGKVFGLPKGEIDRLVHMHHQPPADLSKIERQVLHYAKAMKGFPSHFSIHAGGVLISEQPIHAFSPTEIPPKGFPITQFDMYTAEEIGLYKFDILSQRGLGHIRSAVDIIHENQGISVDVHQTHAFKKDKKVTQMLSKGQTMGCFYIESPAMRGLLSKLGCDNYPTLVAASSVIRPGVARSGMMQEFIRRHNGTPFNYPHPRIKELLDDTYGIMIYQEDVLKMVNGYAGLSLAEADLLRRAMSGKSRDNQEFIIIKEKFLQAAASKGYNPALNQEIWRQIESFAGYSFSKAHSASFAVESFQSLFLKAYYPREFMVGVINNFGGFYDTEIYIHEARMWGARIHPPCVNTSTYLTRIIGKDIYLGFIHLKDLQQKLATDIEAERERRGPFTDMADFVRRTYISAEQLTILIRIGAFRFTGSNKPSLLWEMRLYTRRVYKEQADVLFPPDVPDYTLPILETSPLEDAYDEMELLGFPLASPFSLLGILPEEIDLVITKDFPKYEGHIVHILGYYVCVKTTRTIKGDLMQFANMLDSEGQMFDCTRFPNVVKKYPFIDRGIYLISGKVVDEFGHFTLEMTQMKKLLYLKDPRLQEEHRQVSGVDL
ncbi:MAG: DNA polymerase III subunit alpha [Bacteroidota bacterium]